MPNVREKEWLSPAEARDFLSVAHTNTVRRLARKGLVKYRDIPGVLHRYLRADLERIREGVRPAAV